MDIYDEPAFRNDTSGYQGLSKLELIAAMAMQGILATAPPENVTPDNISDLAIEQAYNLLEKLKDELENKVDGS